VNRSNGKPIKYIVGPNGNVLTAADLPSPRKTRWVFRRKAEIVAAVSGGLLSLDEACSRYELSHEEFLSWRQAIEGRRAKMLTRSLEPHSGPRTRPFFVSLNPQSPSRA
jgi:hypothetical protein